MLLSGIQARWMFQKRVRRHVLLILIIACLLGAYNIYYTTISTATSRFQMYSHMKVVEKLQYFGANWTLKSDNNLHAIPAASRTVPSKLYLHKINQTRFLPDHQSDDPSIKGRPLSYVSRTRSVSITMASKRASTLTPEVFSATTTMTFNNTLVVHCMKSPYIECSPPDMKPKPGKIFNIAYLNRPKWLAQSEMEVSGCQFNQCTMADNNVTNDTDMVVVYGVLLKDTFQVPQRWPHQLYAIHVWEPPLRTGSDFLSNATSPWNQQINVIMSYRVDAEVFIPYEKLMFTPKPLISRPRYYEIAKNKTRTVVWIVSHCKTWSRREGYVKEMQKYIDVDIFGNCGTPCSKNNSACEDWATKYKFYLSFENTLCTDYITEKFFKLFEQNLFVIPVVRGGAEYDKYFPSFTYINTAHFKTPKDLALHLKHLASDLEAYSKYLEYKDLYQIVPRQTFACKICTYVHTQKLPSVEQKYNLQSMHGYKDCRRPSDL